MMWHSARVRRAEDEERAPTLNTLLYLSFAFTAVIFIVLVKGKI